MFSECLLLFDDVRNLSSQNVLPEDGFWTSKIYPLHPMLVLLALFLSSHLSPFTLSALYFKVCVVQPLQLYYIFPLQPPFREPAPLPSRRLDALNQPAPGGHSVWSMGRFATPIARQTCGNTPLISYNNCTYYGDTRQSYKLWTGQFQYKCEESSLSFLRQM